MLTQLESDSAVASVHWSRYHGSHDRAVLTETHPKHLSLLLCFPCVRAKGLAGPSFPTQPCGMLESTFLIQGSGSPVPGRSWGDTCGS